MMTSSFRSIAMNGCAGELVSWRWLAMAVILTAGIAWGQEKEVVRVGEGSYTLRAPAGMKQPQGMVYRTEALKDRPMPTNDWWSSLAWMQFSEAQFPHPLAVKAEAQGLRVWYPGSRITANKVGVFGAAAGEGERSEEHTS